LGIRRSIRNYLESRDLKKFYKQGLFNEGAKVYAGSTIINRENKREKIVIGKHTHIKGELQILAQGGNIEIGDYCYIGEDTRIWSGGASIKIGNRVLIAHNVNIHDNISHPLDADLRHRDYLRILGLSQESIKTFDLRSSPVVIEDDVWIGFNCSILKGVTIGKGAIIGACSLVTKDIPENCIAVGNPAKVIKKNN